MEVGILRRKYNILNVSRLNFSKSPRPSRSPKLDSNVQVKTMRFDLKHNHTKNAKSASPPRKLTSVATTQNLHKHKQI